MRLQGRLLALAIRRPGLVPALVGLAWATRRLGWYRRFPFLPMPPVGYLRWRIETAYGSQDATPPAADAVRYLTWTRRMRRGG
jgi:hypothetical protein